MIQSRFVWLPVGYIDLETALGRLVAAKHGAGFIAEWTPALIRGEYEAQAYGGVRTSAWEDARARVLGYLQQGLQLFKVSKADPPVVRTYPVEFWRSPDRADRQCQRHILDRRDDPFGDATYAVNEAHFMALLDAELNARSSGDASDAKDAGAASSEHREQDGPPPVSARTRVSRGRADHVIQREELLYCTASDAQGAWRDWRAPTAFHKAKIKFPDHPELFNLGKTGMSQCWRRVKVQLETAGRPAGSAAPNPE
jgi:hypothetical protein